MAPSIPQVPYDHTIYHAATNTSLHSVQALFDSKNAQSAINTFIRDCFLKHGVEKTFSACVIHRHFDLAPNERNIEENGRAIASKDLENIYPSHWLFHDGKLYPYEFTRGSNSGPVLPQEFVDELGRVLMENDLCDVIGVQVYKDGVVGFECTDHEKRVSTTVEYGEEETPETEGMVRASFAFFRC